MFNHAIESRVRAAQALTQDSLTFDISRLSNLATNVIQVLRAGNKIAFVGNGGSAAEAMHLAAEFTGKCVVEHVPLAAICLNESQSSLTAISNDYGIDHMFARMVKANLKKGDLLIALSTSGKSKNIIEAIKTANNLGVDTHLWMGDFDISLDGVDAWKVPSRSTPRIQEVHLIWGHILAEVVEEYWVQEVQ